MIVADLDDFSLSFEMVERKYFLAEVNWDVVALSEQHLSFFFLYMFPDSSIVRCGAEAHSQLVDSANIKGHSVPYEAGTDNIHFI